MNSKNKPNRIIQILMERDNMTLQEATNRYNEVLEMLEEPIEMMDHEMVEEIMLDELGLEMDYIIDILF